MPTLCKGREILLKMPEPASQGRAMSNRQG